MRIVNRRARYKYKILEDIEAGIVLSGAEVKSLREGRGSLKESFARIKDGEVWLYNFVIPPYKHADIRGYDPARPRKLLLHKKQILSLFHTIAGKNLTLIPLVCYTTGRFVKVKIGLGKGKREYEKRGMKKKREVEREVARAMKSKR
jgi:SsrA-binding protein